MRLITKLPSAHYTGDFVVWMRRGRELAAAQRSRVPVRSECSKCTAKRRIIKSFCWHRTSALICILLVACSVRFCLLFTSRQSEGSLSDNDVRPSVCRHRAKWGLYENFKTWKFRTMLGRRKSITGCSIMTSSQIQDGGLPVIWKSLCQHISVKMIQLSWNSVRCMR